MKAAVALVPESIAIALSLCAACIAIAGERRASSHSVPLSIDVSRLERAAVPESHALDLIESDGRRTAIASRTAAIPVSRGRTLLIRGWSVDRGARRPSSAVFVTIGRRTFAQSTGEQRVDVADALGSDAYTYAGFALEIPAGSLPLGPHVLRVDAVSANGRDAYPIDPAIPLLISP